jgi:predicted acetyltransferase
MSSARGIDIRQARLEDRLPLYRMLELYQYELSDIWDQDLDAHGEYGYALDRFWTAKECLPVVATVDGRYAGFALVDGAVKVGQSGNWMDQFFVLKKYRGRGLGKSLAYHTFDLRPGYWEVGQMTANAQALAFWRRIIEEYTGGAYTEHTLSSGWWQGVVQAFALEKSRDRLGA